jgi:hypothetical protein
MMWKNPSNAVIIWKEKNTAKAAYEFGVSEGTEIFGQVPDTVRVVEEKPVV